MLLAVTQGRGAWTVQNADSFLTDAPVLRIEGSAADDDFTIRRSADNPSILEVLNGIFEIYSAPVTATRGSRSSGWVRRRAHRGQHPGPLNLPQGIFFDAGRATTISDPRGDEGLGRRHRHSRRADHLTIEDTRGGATQVITYESIEADDVINNLEEASTSRRSATRWVASSPMLAF